MLESPIAAGLAFAITTLLVVGVAWLIRRKNSSGMTRLHHDGLGQDSLTWLDLGQKVLGALPVLGNPWMPRSKKERNALESRMRRAGIFHPQAPLILLGVKA